MHAVNVTNQITTCKIGEEGHNDSQNLPIIMGTGNQSIQQHQGASQKFAVAPQNNQISFQGSTKHPLPETKNTSHTGLHYPALSV